MLHHPSPNPSTFSRHRLDCGLDIIVDPSFKDVIQGLTPVSFSRLEIAQLRVPQPPKASRLAAEPMAIPAPPVDDTTAPPTILPGPQASQPATADTGDPIPVTPDIEPEPTAVLPPAAASTTVLPGPRGSRNIAAADPTFHAISRIMQSSHNASTGLRILVRFQDGDSQWLGLSALNPESKELFFSLRLPIQKVPQLRSRK